MSIPFYLVDVFSRRPLAGNPVAVVLAPDLDDAGMLALAGWTGMPETVFVTRPTHPGADYAIRIFSSLRELAFAGHPSIGACHLLVELGLATPREGILMQECPAGLFELRLDDAGEARTIAFRVPIRLVRPLSPAEAALLGRALAARPDRAYLVEAGARWVVGSFYDPTILGALVPDQAQIRALSELTATLGVSVHAPSPDPDADIEVRSFGPLIGVDEDVVCGGGNACVGAVVAQRDCSAEMVAYTVSQGRHRGRHGRAQVSASWPEATVSVGGAAITTVSGTLRGDRHGAFSTTPSVGPMRRAAP